MEGAARTWFVAMVIAQWIFVYYIAAFYGERTLSGDFAAWDEHPFVKGYVAGDVLGNLSFATHVMLAVLITLGGTLQLVPRIRAQAPWLHRWNGRVFIVLSIIVSLAGFYMVWFRQPVENVQAELAITINGVLILVFAAIAWRQGAARNIDSHRRWAMRTLLVVNGVFFIRLIFSAWLVIVQSEPNTLTFRAFEYGCYLIPLALLQLYFLAQDRGGAMLRYFSAATIYVATAFMAVGAFGFSMIFIRMIVFGQT